MTMLSHSCHNKATQVLYLLYLLFFQKYIKQMKADPELQSKAAMENFAQAKEAKIADKAFMSFREKISSNPDQVIG